MSEQSELRRGAAESITGAGGARAGDLSAPEACAGETNARALASRHAREIIRTPLDAEVRPTLWGKLHQWWIFFVAAMLLLIVGPPVLTVSWLARRREWVYPWALWGGRQWLRLSGMRVVARGRELLDPRQTYIFIANHRSYLDTATLFCHIGRRIGLLAKKELLKVPILGYGMGFVNILAIDRTNRARAIETVRAATERIRAGVSFGVFAEGTRAQPGEILPFKKGAFHMAIDARASVVPVAIKHTDVLMGKGTGQARSGMIEMVILPPIETDGLSTGREEDVAHLIAETRARIAEELLAVAGA
ncbi:MAG: 1-acyl-sn-glycerol-3-phosphate acyltransferase [Acidobacteriota bacterium]|nr:1-acyl-sn-glycerol-3-phosphate acyltransferase [Acidobacteriota bacterium]